MQKRRVGQSSLKISALGLGTVKFGRNQGVKYPESFELPNDQKILELLEMARDLGINFLDTAPAYGCSEERLGKALRNQRKDWVIATKVGEEFIDGASYFDFSKERVIKSVERSLKRLNTDYIDLLFVHSNGEDVRIIEEGIFETLELLKIAGKIRAIGMSTKTINGGLLALNHADALMVSYHPGYQDEIEVIKKANEKNKAVFIKKAFASGDLKNIPTQANDDAITTSMRFIFHTPGITSIVMGTINSKHLCENVEKANKVLEEFASLM